MAKIVDATKGRRTVTGVRLNVTDLRAVFKTPIEGQVVPFWIADMELSDDGEKITSANIRFPYVEGKDPIKEAFKQVKGSDLNGWTVTRFDQVDPVSADLVVSYGILTE
jgi:hypothetical protein